MDWDLTKVLNLVGIALEFASFWFAAPEILGEERLRKIERMIERGILLLPATVILLSGGLWALVLRSNEAWVVEWVWLTTWIVVGMGIVRLLLAGDWEKLAELGESFRTWWGKLFFAAMSVVVGVIQLWECLQWRTDLPLENLLGNVVAALLLLMMSSLIWLPDRVISPLLLKLADDKRIRQRWFVIGIGMFMLAFICQFTAVILG